jgi:serine-type D-Ala-D-Ala carboxypeptidase/endopeptidase (penicillin-binding protein 4)
MNVPQRLRTATSVCVVATAVMAAGVFPSIRGAAQETLPVPVGPPVTSVEGEPPSTGVPTTLPPTLPPVIAAVATTTTVAGATATTVAGAAPTTVAVVAGQPSTTAPVSGGPVLAGDATTTIAAQPSTTVSKGPTTTIKQPARSVAELREQVSKSLALAGGKVSALVVVDGVGRVIDIESATPRPPASTLKVLTGGSALLTLGADHRFVTQLRAVGPVDGVGTLTGDLVLVGGGDPTLSTGDLSALAQQVQAAGIVTVSGRLLVDDGRYDQPSSASGWKPSFLGGEVGWVSAFMVDRNRSAASDPSLSNGERLRTALLNRKVKVVGGVARGAAKGDGRVVASKTSAPLADVVTHMMKKSDNTEAEAMLREIGVSSGAGTAAGGIGVIARQMDRFGLTRPVQFDGSGLSSLNRVSADTMVGWLTQMNASKSAAVFRASLPVACLDGTLKGRLCSTAAARTVQAKTGYIDGVITLAGYGTTASGRRVTFAIFGSQVRSTANARAAIDRAVAEVSASLI